MKSKTTLLSSIALAALALGLGTQRASAFVNVTVTPTNQAVLVSSNAVFNAQASTTAGEVITGYTWLMSTNNQPPYTTIAGATTATCTVTNAQVSDAGFYFVKIAYSIGGNSQQPVASQPVTLAVYDQARIITQPVGGLIRVEGSNATFSVTAAGSAPLVYQWRLNGVNLSNNARIAGADGTNLTINALVTADSGSYDLIVTNIYSSATSQVATLSVLIPPGISAQPHSTAVILGSNALFSVTATGSTPLSYAWSKDGVFLSNGGPISGANTNKLTILAVTTNDAGSYRVLLTNSVGSITSSVATLTVLVPPTITSPTNAAGRQGAFFTYTTTATGTTPITFGVNGLPSGLTLEPTSGVIAGIPVVTGLFNLTLYATNAAMTTTGQLALAIATGVPGINSALSVSGKQGQSFSYGIAASNNPVVFTASTLPTGLTFDPVAGIISGAPIVSGIFQVTISAGNQFGTDTEVLNLTIVSSLPAITSALTASWTENQTNFSYRIRASNSPTDYGASNLPLGLTMNPTNGIISGTPWVGGTYTIPIWANNPWGTGLTNLVLTVNPAPITGLAITDVTPTYSKPYVLDFTFSLIDPNTGEPVVRPINQLQVVCMENGVPISSEAPLILESAASQNSKQFKTCLVLDYTYSMFVVPGAITAMEDSAQLLINSEPPHALFAVVEFNADYMAPQFVTNSLTSTNNFFITDKTVLSQSIYGIETNYVKGNYAGSRCWDAIYAAVNSFGAANPDDQRYIVAMTDGNDDASQFPDDPTAIGTIVTQAQASNVKIYCVAFGNNVNTNALQLLTSQTGGQYYLGATPADLATQFQLIQKDISGQYVLRWATLKRADIPAYPSDGFQPSFQISYAGFTTNWNTNIVITNFDQIDKTQDPPVTNHITTNVVQFPFNPPDWAGDVRVGSLRLVQDADVGPQTIRLRSAYSPRFVRQIQLNYRANYPCTAILSSTAANEILSGWTMMESTDTNGVKTLTMTSSDTNNLLTSIPYAAFGDLVEFDFTYPDLLTATQAFSVFSVDNTIYTNIVPAGLSFTNQNFTNFTKVYPPAPPHGTPIPWLMYYGFKTNFADAGAHRDEWDAGLAGLRGRLEPHQRRLELRRFVHLRAGAGAADRVQHGAGTHLPARHRDQPHELDRVAGQHARNRGQYPLHR